MYNDPSGEIIWFIVAGAIISGYMTGVKANGSWNPFKWNWSATWGKIALGTIVGALSGGAASYVGGLAAVYSAAAWGIKGGILGGAIAGFAGGAVAGAVSGLGNAAIFGENIGRGIIAGFISGAIGGAVIGGTVGGIQQGLANAKVNTTGIGTKGNIWTNKPVAPGRSAWALNNTPKPTTVGKIPKIEVGPLVSEGYIPNKPTDLFDRNPNLAREINMNPDGSWRYPPNNGALGDEVNLTLKPGTYVDRFGTEGGKFVSPAGTGYGARALPPGSFNNDYNLYKINMPINVKASVVAPYFGNPGLGTQYRFSEPIYKLIEKGVLIKVP
ncbi:TNT domain-containing protein [Riemerella anatipestifer]|uniref:TNT domain-containing protein n=1 Tax=Riemerella anatipestifer TaxID=34085 RepID=UPI001BDA2940|nr:TNT domain-containing protein [Riemerella anatipestifer]MBT0552589.1 TNT domain-containing protein [Riemerella anatipestifer]MBT0554894.1 TNT domain-containing protein [Riemerella anatipestifer]MCU7543453.1 TNT domain-containing protein [Riemerella anatipestifer]MCU7561061.1 TNT domain-containing protein [Riemerella anatipestifer]MCW0514226.1 TNT domain-containing protein [Riemerella anatipestifer]